MWEINSENQTWAENYDNQMFLGIVNPTPRPFWSKVPYIISIHIVESPSLAYISSPVSAKWLIDQSPSLYLETKEVY